jgi:error-prone DNA polymerase
MGFYQPPQLVADARRHGIEVRPIDVCHSDWDCTLEPWPGDPRRQPALRLGLRLARGMREDAAVRISAERARAPFRDLDDLAARADLDRATLDLLAEAAALRSLAGHRHRARWSTAGTERQLPLFANANAHAVDAGSADVRPASAHPPVEARIAIPPPSVSNTHADYASTGLPRRPSGRAGVPHVEAASLLQFGGTHGFANGRHTRFAGLAILRQRPRDRQRVTFLT